MKNNFIFLVLLLAFACKNRTTEKSGEIEIDAGEKELEARNSSKSGLERPDYSRFIYEVVADRLDEPLEVEFDRQGHVYWIERNGAIKRIHENSGQVELLAELPVAVSPEPGLIGFLLDRDFEKTRQLYVYYSADEDKGNYMRLSRLTLKDNGKIEKQSEVVLLRVFWEYPDSRHFGGGMVWDKAGNLYLSIGGDTQATQYAPLTYTNPKGRGQDAARTAGNSNDLRGSILRIRPQADGSYTIPKGNLFPEEIPKTKPEIYIMGNRNPWRLSIDSETGYLHWGEVGPDAGIDSEQFGPMGFDEFNVAKEPGNYGWPFIIGNNRPYNRYDYASDTFLGPFDPEAPINDSPNNTGLRKLPPAKPSLLAYPYKISDTWPILGSAARSAVGGPIFRAADFDSDAPRVFPNYYDGKWLVTDYVRNWIMVLSMNEERTEILSIEPLVPLTQLSHKQALDMDFGPSGDLYVIEYGEGGQGRLSKLRYNAGNRTPMATARAETLAGSTPLKVHLFSNESTDNDGDNLKVRWTVAPAAGGESRQYAQPNPVVTIDQPGKYRAVLTVEDPTGASDSDTLELVAGNESPEVQIDVVKGNRSFYFPDETITYQVLTNDREDGSLQNGGISPDKVTVKAEYIPSGITLEQLSSFRAAGKIRPDIGIRHLQVQSLLTKNNCVACHRTDAPLIGPAFMDVAKRYKNDAEAVEKLSRSIINGGSGKWEEFASAMPAQPMLSPSETQQIVDYILGLADPKEGKASIAAEGKFKTIAYTPPQGSGGRLARFYSPAHEMGSYVLHASYTDQGNSEVAGLQLTGDDFMLLRYPLLPPEQADILPEEGISYTPSTNDPGFIFTGKGSYIGFKNIDLTAIRTIKVGAITRFWHWSHFIGATVEVRLGSPTGSLIGEPFEIIPPDTAEGDGPFFNDDWEKPISVGVSEIDGIHDIFIVVHNEKAKDSDALVIMTGVGFEQ